MKSLAAPAGDPGALARDVDDLQRISDAIQAAADALMAVVYDSSSQAVDALAERATATRSRLDQAHARYEGTTHALRDYQVALHDFHASANRAIEDERHARYRYAVADQAYDDAVAAWRRAALDGGDPAAVESAKHHVDRAHRNRDAAEDDINDAWALYRTASAARDEAAARAKARISASFAGTNDSTLDKIGAAIASVADFLAAVAQWATEILVKVLEAIAVALAAIVVVIVAIVVVLALVAIAIVLLALAIVIVAAAIALVLRLVALAVLYLVAVGVVAIAAVGLAHYLHLSDQDTLRLLALALSIACPPLGGILVARIVDEALKPTPEVTPYDRSGANPMMVAAQTALDHLRPDDVSDLIYGAGLVDAAGGGLNHSDRTVVDVAEVRDPNGNITGYIVTLPSTLDWVLDSWIPDGIDPAAVNDLDADLLTMLAPEVKGQYERAVLEAMRQAGIPPGAPVLMTGFSLGGIMAAHMADTRSGDYVYAGVVVAGSSIDHMHLPDNMPVLQAKHVLDAVHEGDLIAVGELSLTHREVWDGPLSSVGIQGTNPVEAHDPFKYSRTIAAGDVSGSLSANFDAFLISEAEATAGWTISHEQFEFAE